MVCVNSIINPFVYVIQYHEFQNRTKEIFCGKKKGFGESGSVSTAMTEDAEVKEIALDFHTNNDIENKKSL